MLCVVGPVVCFDFPFFIPLSVAVDERGQNRAMEGKGELVREGLLAPLNRRRAIATF